jgi:serine/threonine-protein kinase
MGDVQRYQGRFTEAIKSYELAIELSPNDTRLLQNLGSTQMSKRDYANAQRSWERLISLAPDQAGAYYQKAMNEFYGWGDLKATRSTLESMPETGDPNAVVYWYWQLICERKYEDAQERLASTSNEVFQVDFAFWPKLLLSAWAHSLQDELESARADYEAARIILERELQHRPDFSRLHSALAIAYAGLGMREKANRQAQLGATLPRAFGDEFHRWEHARTLTILGEHDAALEQIEALFSVPSLFSVPALQLEPWWDPLRQHPRYKEIIEKYGHIG